MRPISTTKPFTCAACAVEISGRPTIHVGLPFCCAGCVAGGCTCPSGRAAPAIEDRLEREREVRVPELASAR